jgi:hypothetical protein
VNGIRVVPEMVLNDPLNCVEQFEEWFQEQLRDRRNATFRVSPCKLVNPDTGEITDCVGIIFGNEWVVVVPSPCTELVAIWLDVFMDRLVAGGHLQKKI